MNQINLSFSTFILLHTVHLKARLKVDVFNGRPHMHLRNKSVNGVNYRGRCDSTSWMLNIIFSMLFTHNFCSQFPWLHSPNIFVFFRRLWLYHSALNVFFKFFINLILNRRINVTLLFLLSMLYRVRYVSQLSFHSFVHYIIEIVFGYWLSTIRKRERYNIFV